MKLLPSNRRVDLFFKQFALNRIEAERFANACETASMNWRRAELFQQTAVLRRRIAFVSSKVIAWMYRIKFTHQSVAGGLGDDRSGRDAGGKRIALDYPSLRRRAIWNAPRIN